MRENDALCASLLEECDSIKRDTPSLLVRRDVSRAALEEALSAIERLEQSDLAATLGDGLMAEGGGVSGEGSLLDERIALTGERLEAAMQEAEGKVRILEQFSSSARDAMETAADKRIAAQGTLEALAAEQRKASEEMRTTLTSAMVAMEAMQVQWDDAVVANAAELRDLKRTSSERNSKQAEAVASLRGVQGELTAQSVKLVGIMDDRSSLAEEEATLQRRFSVLRQKRIARLQGWSVPTNLEDAGALGTEAAEILATGAEKAAVGLLRLFGNAADGKPAGKPQLPGAGGSGANADDTGK